MAKGSVDRRDFLKGAAVTSAAALVPARHLAAAASRRRRRRRHSRPAPPRSRPRNGPGRRCRSTHHRSARRRLHGRRPEVAQLRVHRLEPGLELPRHPRIDHQLRQQPAPEFITCCHEESSVAMAHGYFKVEGKPMAVLCHGTVGLQHAAMAIYNAYCDRVPGLHPRRQHARCDDAAAGRGVGAQRAGRRGDGARLHQVGRQPGLAAALRRVGGARLQDRDDAADDAGARRHRRRPAGGSNSPRDRRAPAGAEADDRDAASGRLWRRRRSGAPARQRAEPGDRGGPPGADAGRHHAARRAGGSAAGAGHRSARADELPVEASAQPDRKRRPLIANADVILGLELTDFWGTVSCVPRFAAPHVAVAHQAGHAAHQHHRRSTSSRRATSRTSSDIRRWTSRWPPTRKRRCRR